MSEHEVESVVVLPLPPRYRLKDLLLGEQHSEDDRYVADNSPSVCNLVCQQ